MSLTETAFYTRRVINWAILGIIAYVLLRIFWSIFITLFFIFFPPKAIPPNHAFGRLPAIKFPAAQTNQPKLTYQLQTIEGTVPAASGSAQVFFMPKTPPNLLGLNAAQDLASRMQFDPTPVAESKNIYRFNDADFPQRRLRYEIISNNFILRYAFEQDPSVFSERKLPQPDSITPEAVQLLQSFSLYNDDLSGGTSAVTFWKLQGTSLVPATSLSQSDAVRVDFFRAGIGQMKIFTPNPDEASVNIIFSGSSNNKKRILQLAYTFWPIDYQTYATYEVKTSAQAWQELQNGQGYIARNPSRGTAAIVRNVYLGYYDSFEPQTYLQPIFVFEGDDGFLGYVPAISPPWTE